MFCILKALFLHFYRKDESKEPIVEVRTEEERTPNHEGGGPTEPNETTPLTDPEWVSKSPHATQQNNSYTDKTAHLWFNMSQVTLW